MRLIIDPKLANRLESMRLRPNRMFHCGQCNINCGRNSVQKDAQGNYSCIHCGGSVVDITDTSDGQQIASIVGL